MICLKSRERGADGWPKLAVLVSPNCSPKNDEELYAAVKAAGGAIIELSFADSSPIELDPTEFQSTWRGD